MAVSVPSLQRMDRPHVHIAGEICPWCEQVIPHDKFAEIHQKIETKEKERVAEIEAGLSEQFLRDKATLEAKAKAEVDAATNAAAGTIAKAEQDKELAVEAAKRDFAAKAEQAARESAAKIEAAKDLGRLAAEQSAAAKVAEAEAKRQEAIAAQAAAEQQVQERLSELAREKAELTEKIETAKAEALLSAAEKVAAADKKRAEAEEARLAVEQQFHTQKAAHEEVLNARIAEVRESLEKDKLSAVQAEQRKAFDDKQKLQETVQELQRKIDRKTADELGEGAEIDLFETLKSVFEEDRFRRVQKGEPGADVIHEIVLNGRVCGKIVYDSKNRKAWQNVFATKLRADMISERADHAILSTNRFPSGAQQLHLQDGVIVACPARVVALAELLRGYIVQTFTLRMSNEERQEKTAALYAFVTSEQCSQLLGSIESLVGKLEEIDVAEQKAHTATWEKRGRMLRSVLKAHADVMLELNRILGVTADEE